MKVGQICVVRGSEGGMWVGEVVELLRVVFNEDNPDEHNGDVVLHEYGGLWAEGKWKTGSHVPLYKNRGSNVMRKTQASERLLVTVWAESVAHWGVHKEVLTRKGMLTAKAKQVLEALGY